jgi:hypothetical protein
MLKSSIVLALIVSSSLGAANPSTVAIYRQGDWFIDANGSHLLDAGDPVFAWGNVSSLPVQGDWNGNGKIKAGVFVSGNWYLDVNGNGFFDTGDRAFSFGPSAGIPIVGDWNGDGKSKVGVFYQGTFYLDTNNDGMLDAGDQVISWGSASSTPLVGDWNGDGRTKIGIYDQGIWSLDVNGDGYFDSGDRIFAWGQGTPGAVPVLGDWNGDGRTKGGIFAQGVWYLDVNGDGVWDTGDRIFAWGQSGSTPVVGDWNGSGTSKAGVFYQGNWYLDVNGDGVFDEGDAAFGWGATGDTPLVGNWQPFGAAVLTQHNDDSRDGLNAAEGILTPSNVTASRFGKLFSHSIDGYAYAQPLFVPFLEIPGKGLHDVVFVATEHDGVYAFDANNGSGANANPLWYRSFISPGSGITTVSSANDLGGCGQTGPESGITGTPVIDTATQTMYLIVATKEPGSTFVQRLHALDITTGLERSGSPVVIAASVPGSGDGGTTVSLIPKNYKARPGLLLLNGVVYTAWSSHCDAGTYHGWIIGYDKTTLQQVGVYNTTPNGHEASLWNAGAGLAADGSGNIFISTANGDFDASQSNYGDSFVRVSATTYSALDYFTPFNQSHLEMTDGDLGSGGLILLPDSVGSVAHPHLLVGAGKAGTVFLVDRDNMGQYNSNGSGPDHMLQSFSGITGSWGMPAYFNGSIYFGGSGDTLKAFSISSAAINTNLTSQSPGSYTYPGTTPSVSANGTGSGIVWTLENSSPAILHAYDATNLATELFNSGVSMTGSYVGFTTPTVTGGKVYVGTQSTLEVFGLF